MLFSIGTTVWWDQVILSPPCVLFKLLEQCRYICCTCCLLIVKPLLVNSANFIRTINPPRPLIREQNGSKDCQSWSSLKQKINLLVHLTLSYIPHRFFPSTEMTVLSTNNMKFLIFSEIIQTD